MDIRQTLRYLGAPIGSTSYLFGDNRSVITSGTLPHTALTKCHNILACHRVKEAIAAKSLLSIGSNLPTTYVICSPSIGITLVYTQ